MSHRGWSTCAATPEYLRRYSRVPPELLLHASALRETSALTSAQHEVLVALARCRTAALGGHATPVYNSCRNRHCPTRYFHVVFTLPEAMRAIVRYNRTALFAMLFRAASQTLLALAHCPPSRWCCTP